VLESVTQEVVQCNSAVGQTDNVAHTQMRQLTIVPKTAAQLQRMTTGY